MTSGFAGLKEIMLYYCCLITLSVTVVRMSLTSDVLLLIIRNIQLMLTKAILVLLVRADDG